MLDEAKTQVYAKYLNDKVSTILPTDDYIGEALTENYENTLLNSNFLTDVGLKDVGKDLSEYVKVYQEKFGSDKIWRSIFFYFADELRKRGHPRYAARIKWISSAIWNNVFLESFELKPAFPHTYSEAIDSILAKQKVALQLNPVNIDDYPFENISLDLDDIRYLDAPSILNIRKTREAKSYFQRAKVAEHKNSPLGARNLFIEAQELYLASLSDQLASIATGRQRKIASGQRKLHVAKWTGAGGSIGIALITLPFGASMIISAALIGAGIIWLGVSNLAESTLSECQKKETRLAHQQWKAMKGSQGQERPIISVSETRKGIKPPLF